MIVSPDIFPPLPQAAHQFRHVIAVIPDNLLRVPETASLKVASPGGGLSQAFPHCLNCVTALELK